MLIIGKKAALLTALLLPVSAFAASNSLYGDFRYSISNVDDDSDSNLGAVSNASRVGLKGISDEMDGITGFYHLQAGASIDGNSNGDAITQRFFFAGFKGDFGKVVFGRTSTPYKMAGLKVDPFYDSSAGLSAGGASYGLSGLTNGWSDNTLAYSKKIDAFIVNAGVYLDDSAENSNDFNFGVTYNQDGIKAGMQYIGAGDTGVIANAGASTTAIRFHGQYTMDMITIAGSLESIDPDAGDTQRYLYLSSTYKLNEKVKLAGSYGSVDDVNVFVNGDSITVGAFYQLLKKTQVHGLFSSVSAGTDYTTIALGVSHKFASK